MDIKMLVKEDRGLEQWEPVLKASFPLDRSVVSGQIFPYLAFEPPHLFRSTYQMDQFLDEVIGVDRLSKGESFAGVTEARDLTVFTPDVALVTQCASSVRNDTMQATLHRWKKGRLEDSVR
jgi:hypothetical protein